MKWGKRRLSKKIIGLTLLGFFGLIVLAQLAWPNVLSRPFTYWDNKSVSMKTQAGLVQVCQKEVAGASFTVVAEKKARKTILKPGDINTNFDCQQFAKAAISYPLRKKIIPFSLFIKHDTANPHLAFSDEQKFMSKVEEVGRRLEVAPQNAQLLITEGKIVQKNATYGTTYPSKKLSPQLLAIEWPQLNNTVVYGDSVKPTIEASELNTVKKEVEDRITGEFTLGFNKKKHVVPAAQITTWLSVQTLDKDKPEILYYPEAAEKYINDNKKVIVKDLGMSSIAVKQSAQVAVDSLKESKKLAMVSQEVTTGSASPIAASPGSIAEFIAGLEAKGESIGLYVKKIGGGTQYGTNAERVYTSASTYKLFVAYSVMRRIDSGELAWTSSINGTTVEACFEKMIVVSDNACPQAFLARYGFSTVQAEARAIGAAQASFSPGNMRVSSQSLGVLLEKLHNGTLVSPDSRSRVLGLMRRQIFRKGIPAGTSYPVADKVGFLNALLHDAGVIETPQGNYVVVIMSDKSSWGRIAELTRMIASTL
jgi:beta-lactamase class A